MLYPVLIVLIGVYVMMVLFDLDQMPMRESDIIAIWFLRRVCFKRISMKKYRINICDTHNFLVFHAVEIVFFGLFILSSCFFLLLSLFLYSVLVEEVMEKYHRNSSANNSTKSSPSIFRSLYRRLIHRSITFASYCKPIGKNHLIRFQRNRR